MLVYRFEHDRKICKNENYRDGGESLTGHGTFTYCLNKKQTPNFGLNGLGPDSIMSHERCAVTAAQFAKWIGYTTFCRYTTKQCGGSDYCNWCPETKNLNVPKGWNVVIYRLKDSGRNIDWRVDNGQIVFNPAFAERVGNADLAKIRRLAKDAVNA